MHRKDLGTFGEMVVITSLIKAGYNVYNSIGDNTRVDIIAENTKGMLYKIQVKTRNRSNGCTQLELTKSGPNYQYKYTTSQVDYFAVVDFDSTKIAWIPSSILDEMNRVLTLRHEPTRNNVLKNVKWFADFENIPFEL